MKLASSVAIAALSFAALSPAGAASLHRSYAYFTIHGNTAAALDRELRRRGPFLESDGERHAGASTMRFDTMVKYAQNGRTCRIAKAEHLSDFVERFSSGVVARCSQLCDLLG